MLGALGHGGAADVDVGAPANLIGAVLIGKDDAHRGGPFLLLGLLLVGRHLAHVIGVAQGDVAFAFLDRLDLAPVIALGPARQIGLHAAGPGFGRRLALGRHDRGEQRDVVGVLAGTAAHPPLHLRIGQVLVRGDLARPDPVLVRENHPRPHGQAEPQPVRMAVLRRDVRLQDARFDRLQEAGLGVVVQVADVRGQDRVRGAVCALGPEPLEHAVLHVSHVDLDARRLGEGLEQRLHEKRLARRVDVDLARPSRRCGERGGECGSEQNGARQARGNGGIMRSHRPKYSPVFFVPFPARSSHDNPGHDDPASRQTMPTKPSKHHGYCSALANDSQHVFANDSQKPS